MQSNALEGIRRGLRDVQSMLAGDASAGRIHKPAKTVKNEEFLPPAHLGSAPGATLRFHDRGDRKVRE